MKKKNNAKVWLDFDSYLKDFCSIPSSQASIDWNKSDSEDESKAKDLPQIAQHESLVSCKLGRSLNKVLQEKSCQTVSTSNSDINRIQQSEASKLISDSYINKNIKNISEASPNGTYSTTEKPPTSPIFQCRKRRKLKLADEKKPSFDIKSAEPFTSQCLEDAETERATNSPQNLIYFRHRKNRHRLDWTSIHHESAVVSFEGPKSEKHHSPDITDDPNSPVRCTQESETVRMKDDITDVQTPVKSSSNDSLLRITSVSSLTNEGPPTTGEKKGSDWVKKLQYSTPEKPKCSPCKSFYEIEPPDSSKKKIKRNGHAERLQKFIQSWHSDYFMWNHQMTQTTAANQATESPLPQSSSSSRSHRSVGSSVTSKPSSWKGSFRPPKRSLTLRLIKKALQSDSFFCTEATLCKDHNGDAASQECHHLNEDKANYLLYLGQYGLKKIDFKIGDIIKIFAPWQSLALSNQMTAVFSSHYIVESDSALNPGDSSAKGTKKMVKSHVASWSCTCTGGDQSCDGRMVSRQEAKICLSERLLADGQFTLVKETADVKKFDASRIWTIQEAVDASNSSPNSSFAVTLRILRIIPQKRKDASGPSNAEECDPISHYLVLGQDPAGAFSLLEIPNFPLAASLQGVIDGVGSTRTLTHLTLGQRITDAQDPPLFWLIASLHACYEKAITESAQLSSLLPHQLNKNPQKFCYKFCVNLGVTRDIYVAANEGPQIQLPDMSSLVPSKELNGQRGFMKVLILYCIKAYIYVIFERTEEDLLKQSARWRAACRIKMNKLFEAPPWIKTLSPILALASIQDCVIHNENYMVDEYSLVNKVQDASASIRENLHAVISPLLPPERSKQYIVSVQGVIERVKEEDALIWEVCAQCGDENVTPTGPGCCACLKCKRTDAPILMKYQLQVFVKLNEEIHGCQDIVLVKLFQRTIEKLLHSISSNSESYNAKSLIGKNLTSLVCLNDHLVGKGSCTSLTELDF